MRTARAKGLPPSRVIGLHALRNALIPVVTVIGLQVGLLFSGAILTETIFAWPGIGKWLVDSIARRDYPSVQGGVRADRDHGHAGQSAGRPALRPDQPAHPAREVSHGRAARRRRPAGGRDSAARAAARVLALFQREPGRGRRPRRDALVVSRRAVRRRHRAARAVPAVPRPFPGAAGLAGGRQRGVPARHRRGRPRHPLAHHLRRALLAADRPDRGHALALGRHRAGPRRRLLPRLARDHDHAPDGHHPGAAEPAAGDRDRGDPRARADQRHDRGRGHLSAALHPADPRLGDRRADQGLRRGQPGQPAPAGCA